jgi:hypothetical protein
VKVITVRQPWAWAIAMGHKTVENRTWTTSYRGPLAIHSAKRWDDYAMEALTTVIHTMRDLDIATPPTLAHDLPYSDVGRVLAVVDLVDICDGKPGCDCGPWAMGGHKHWRLANVRRLVVPTPAKGRLGLWNFDVDGQEAAA